MPDTNPRHAAVALVLCAMAAVKANAAEPDELDEVVVTGRRVSEASVAIGTDQATATVAITRARYTNFVSTIGTGTTGLGSFRPGPPRTFQLTLSASL